MRFTCRILLLNLAACLFLFLFLGKVVYAQKTKTDIVVHGEQGDIKVPSGILQSMNPADAGQSTQSLLNWFRENAWINASIDSVVHSSNRSEWHVRPGCRYTVRDVHVDVKPDSLYMPLQTSVVKGEYFSKIEVNQFISAILASLEEEGYLLAEIDISKVLQDKDSCEITLQMEIDAGERIKADGVIFSGVEQNSPFYLENVAGVDSDEWITPEVIEMAKRNLLTSNLLVSVSEPDLVFRDDQTLLRFDVEEQQLNFFDGVLGFVPDEDGSAQIVGTADLRLRNIITDGTNLEIKFEQLRPLVTKLFIEAEQQFIAGMPLRAGGSAHFTQQDSAYLERDFEFKTGFLLLPGFELIGTVRSETSSVSQQPGRSVMNLNSRATFFGFGFEFRNIDRLLVPTNGYSLRVHLENGRRFITDERFDDSRENDFRQTILNAELQGFLQLGSRQILSPRLVGHFIDSPAFLVTDLHRFGGAESIRGFREDQFRASSVLWGDLEFRQLLGRDSYIFGFGAFGRFRRPQLINEETNIFEATQSIESFGFGVAFQTNLGFLKVTYAISPEDDISNGKVHVGISAGL